MGEAVKYAGALALAVVVCFAGVARVHAQRDHQAASQTAKKPAKKKDAKQKVSAKAKIKKAKKKPATKSEANRNRVFELGEVEVVGKEAGSRNTTVDRIYSDQMRLFDRNNVATAADLTPGVTVAGVGARNETELNIRGFGMREIPVFLDGVPIYDTYYGYPPLAEFSTYGLSEMTISKGFTSVLYGPNTMGGAINLITMKPEKQFEVNGGSGYGSGNSYHGYMNFGSNQGKWYIEGGGSYENQDYFNLPDSFAPTVIHGPGRTVGYQGEGKRVNSGFDDWIGHVKLGLTPNATDEYAVSFMRLEEQKDVPPYVGTDPNDSARWWQWPSWEFQDVHFNSNTSICGNSYVKTTAFYDIYDNQLNSYTNGGYDVIKSPPGYSFLSYYHDYSYGGSMESGTKLVPHNYIQAAFHFKDDVHTAWETIPVEPKTRDEDRTYSFGVQDTVDFTKSFYSIVGVSYDWLQTVEAEDVPGYPLLSFHTWNPQVGLFYKLGDTGTIHASVEDKSRLPTLFERYAFSLRPGLPNPYLKPEKVTNYEVGYKGLFAGRVALETTAFYNAVHDYILDVPTHISAPGGGVYYRNQNVGHVDLYGMELGLSGHILPCLKGGMNYSYLQYINVGNNLLLTDLPHNKVFAYLQYFPPVKGWSMLGSVEYNSSRYSDAAYAPAVASGYALVNFKEIYEIYHGVWLEGGINNILDDNWELQEGFPLAGRTYFVRMRFKY